MAYIALWIACQLLKCGVIVYVYIKFWHLNSNYVGGPSC